MDDYWMVTVRVERPDGRAAEETTTVLPGETDRARSSAVLLEALDRLTDKLVEQLHDPEPDVAQL